MRIHKGKTRSRYPKPVARDQFTLLQRVKARVDRAELRNGVFLGYCQRHQQYYVDRQHMNNEIRCPLCEKHWLGQHGFY